MQENTHSHAHTHTTHTNEMWKWRASDEFIWGIKESWQTQINELCCSPQNSSDMPDMILNDIRRYVCMLIPAIECIERIGFCYYIILSHQID